MIYKFNKLDNYNSSKVYYIKKKQSLKYTASSCFKLI